MRQQIQHLKKALGIERLSWRFIALSFTLLMASSWMADFLSEIMIKLWDDPKDIVTSLRHYSLHLLISFSALIIAYHWAKNAWEESFEVRTVSPYPKAGICFLSSKSINNQYNPWEMNAYFVAHYPSMAYLLVITSAGDDGSFHQYDAFVSEIKLAHPNLILIHYAQHYHSTGENFIHLPALKTVCKNAYQLLANMYQCDDSDIVFDATSGTKECSIAATISTLKDGRYLHYTNKHKQGTTFDIHE
jgi:hypothetical protein